MSTNASSVVERPPRRLLSARSVLLVLALLIPAAGAATWVYTKPVAQVAAAPTPPRSKPVQVRPIEPAAGYRIARRYTGEVTARRVSELGFERPGRLIEVLVEDGSRVKAGDVLARLDTSKLEASRKGLLAEHARAAAVLSEMKAGPRAQTIAAADARLRDLKAQLQLQLLRRSRLLKLRETNSITQQQLDDVIFSVISLKARIDAATGALALLQEGTRKEQIAAQEALIEGLLAQLATLDVDIEQSSLKAPFDGAVAKRHVDEGTVSMAGQTIMRLVEDGHLEARIGVPEDVSKQLEIGEQARLWLDAEEIGARLLTRLPELDAATRTVTLVLEINDAGREFVSPGQIVRLEIGEQVESPGFWLPIEALTKSVRGLWSCYLLLPFADAGAEQPAFRIERCELEVLHSEGTRAFVRGPLRAGDLVMTAGTHRVVPGQRVHPASAPSETSGTD